ncbi:ribosomal protein S18 acetylase RimI-like enzyme [Chryseobacterium sp. 7]|uniref:GNAT family N-acetyltransferase n=1 Tax=Chryseobacterium sp. 7 TaxID=2035214 RepID=UPI000EB31B6B|nr:GNAT family N-acetyltransferase [Chryseobacterium sp. 7]RLJ32170.1 ribosomal protein S18 acetylase RimI-like enzyme [Chryseobacterium sp. 7]
MNINYRKIFPEESKIYRTIRLESLEKFPESFGTHYQEALKIDKFRMENDIEQQTAERFVLGAFDNKKLIGICAFVKEKNTIGAIYQMYVKKEYQGQNIGLKLIEAVIDEAHQQFPGIEIHLEVTPGNEKAYKLYKKAGFEEIKNPSHEELNKFIMMKYMTE